MWLSSSASLLLVVGVVARRTFAAAGVSPLPITNTTTNTAITNHIDASTHIHCFLLRAGLSVSWMKSLRWCSSARSCAWIVRLFVLSVRTVAHRASACSLAALARFLSPSLTLAAPDCRYLVNHFELSKEYFYQRAIRNFSHFPRIALQPATSLKTLLEIAFSTPEIHVLQLEAEANDDDNDPRGGGGGSSTSSSTAATGAASGDGSVGRPATAVSAADRAIADAVELLVSKADMLDECVHSFARVRVRACVRACVRV